MNAKNELLAALKAPYVNWVAHGNLLTAVWPGLGQIMVWMDGRTFVISRVHPGGEWRWWPWTRRKIAKAAAERYAIEMKRAPRTEFREFFNGVVS